MTLLELFYNYSLENCYLSKKTLQKMNISLKLHCYELLNRSISSIYASEIQRLVNDIDNHLIKKKIIAYLNIMFKYARMKNLI